MKKTNENVHKLLKILNDLEYHDGSNLGEALGITRAAIWKLIKKLKAYGIAIQSCQSKGYRLLKPLILLDEKKIKAAHNTAKMHLEIFEKIDSTNDYLKKQALSMQQIAICLAEMQTAGKGRLNREWYSPFAENIYLSLRYPLTTDISQLNGISLLAGLAICKAIETLFPMLKPHLRVKWPNDVWISGEKLAGTLMEIQAESHGNCQIIFGIGLNVNMQQVPKTSITQKWTALTKATNTYIDRNPLCASLITQLIAYIERFLNKGFKDFQTEWKKRDALTQRTLRLSTGTQDWEGDYLGINAQGHLLLRTRQGKQLSFAAGDATLLKY